MNGKTAVGVAGRGADAGTVAAAVATGVERGVGIAGVDPARAENEICAEAPGAPLVAPDGGGAEGQLEHVRLRAENLQTVAAGIPGEIVIALLETETGDDVGRVGPDAHGHRVAQVGVQRFAFVEEQTLVELRIRAEVGRAELQVVTPRQGHAVVECVALEVLGLVRGDVLVRRLVIAAPEIGVADGGSVAALADDFGAAVVVRGHQAKRNAFLHADDQIGFGAVGDRVDVGADAPERVVVGPGDGAVDFRESDDLALVHLQHIAQQSFAEPAVALEFDLAEFSDQQRDAQRAVGDALGWDDRRREWQILGLGHAFDDAGDGHEHAVVEDFVLTFRQAPEEWVGLEEERKGRGQHHEAAIRNRLEGICPLDALGDEDLPQVDRSRGGDGRRRRLIEQDGDAERAVLNALRRYYHGRLGEVLLVEGGFQHEFDRREEGVVDGAVLSVDQPAMELGDVEKRQGRSQCHEARPRRGRQGLRRLDAVGDEDLPEQERSRGGRSGGVGCRWRRGGRSGLGVALGQQANQHAKRADDGEVFPGSTHRSQSETCGARQCSWQLRTWVLKPVPRTA